MAFNLLNALRARTGRILREDSSIINEADMKWLQDLSDPTAMVFRKKGFFIGHLRESVASSNVHYYSFTTPADKYIAVYIRTLDAGEGPVRLENVVGATFTPGNPLTPVNLFTGGPASSMTITEGATNVLGGTTIPNDFLFGAGNKVATAGSSGLPTVLPPNLTVLLKVTNESGGVNPGIRLALAWTEFDEVPV